VKPGSSPADIVQSMDRELIVVRFRNATADGANQGSKGRRVKSFFDPLGHLARRP
jgi:hypothetical protein